MIGKHRTIGRVIGRITPHAPVAFTAPTTAIIRHIEPGVSNSKKAGLSFQVICTRSQRRVIVKDINATPKGTYHQVTLAALDFQVPHRNSWQRGQLGPLGPAIIAEEQPEFRAHKQKIRVDMIFDNGVCRAAFRQVVANELPADPLVFGSE